jgi:glutamyl-tRNA reductase
LFTVASSLDSMVLGETQILGQVRGAYETSLAAGATGPLLNPLFQRAVAVGKEVLTRSKLGEGRVSVASVAVDYARRIFDHFGDKTVLCVGTGKMAQLVLQRFAELKPGQLMVCSRDLDRAQTAAAPYGGQGVLFSGMEQHLVQSDIVITSTGAPHAVITRKKFEPLLRQRRYRPIFLIDIAVPRDVETAVGDLESVYLYNLDDLQEVVLQTMGDRQTTAAVAKQMVAGQVDAFAQWQRQRAIGPLIDALYKRSADIAQAELARTIGKMQADEKQREHLEELVHRIVQKMLHEPVRHLRTSEPHEGVPGYAHAVEKLFGLHAREEATERPGDSGSSPSGGG